MMKSWWQNKNPREQLLIKIMLAAVLVAVYWYGAVVPLNEAIEKQGRENHTLSRNLKAMDSSAQNIGLTKAKKLTVSVDKVISESAQRAGLNIQLQPSGQAWTVSLTETELSPFIAWLEDLKNNEGIYPAELKLTAQGNNRVKVEKLVLKQAGFSD